MCLCEGGELLSNIMLLQSSCQSRIPFLIWDVQTQQVQSRWGGIGGHGLVLVTPASAGPDADTGAGPSASAGEGQTSCTA